MNLLDIVNKIFKKIRKYKVTFAEAAFIKENSHSWGLPNAEKKIGVIIEGFNSSPMSIIDKSRLAKIVEEKYDVKSMVLCTGFFQRACDVACLYQSFSIVNFRYCWRKYFNISLLFIALFHTLRLYIFFRKPEDLLTFKYRGILIGDLIYDTIIRYIPGSYTVKSLKVKGHLRHVFRCFANCYYYSSIFRKNQIKAVITSHIVYVEYGVLSRIGHKYGATIIMKDHNVFKVYGVSDNIHVSCLRVKDSEITKNYLPDILDAADAYINNRLNGSTVKNVCGSNSDVEAAFLDKKSYSKNDLFESLSVPYEKRDSFNVFIMAHAFSDAPHFGEALLFNDYYCWLIETIQVLANVAGVNLFLKQHPSSHMWGESDSIREILSTYKFKNIYVVPADFNTASIKDIADCIVTAQGTAGLEFSCFGLPAITAAKGWYDRFGFTLDSDTKGVYLNRLLNIKAAERLHSKQIEKARLVLYLSMAKLQRSSFLPEDDLCPGDDRAIIQEKQYLVIVANLRAGMNLRDDVYNAYQAELDMVIGHR
jgi:hypothetical protein